MLGPFPGTPVMPVTSSEERLKVAVLKRKRTHAFAGRTHRRTFPKPRLVREPA